MMVRFRLPARSALVILLLLPCPAATQVIDSSFILFSFRGESEHSNAGSYLNCLGDINSDGYSDIAVSSSSPIGTYIFYGNPDREAEPDGFLRGYHGPATAIDVDVDGIKEIVVAVQDGYPSIDGTLLIYRTFPDSIASEPYDSIRPPSPNYYFGQYFAVGDPDMNGSSDLLISQPEKTLDHHEEFSLYEASPVGLVAKDWNYEMSSIQHNTDAAGQSATGFIDFNGDSAMDIFVGHTSDPDDPNFVGFFRGPGFDTVPSDTLFPTPLDTAREQYFAYHVYNLGDVNGDGWEDLGMSYDHWSIIYLCGPNWDQQYDYVLQTKSRYMASIGDINDDGYGDIAVGAWRTADGTVDVYLGGPRFDTIPDDIIYRLDLPPWFLDNLGAAIHAAGDFDGDGVDDFVFSCSNFTIEQRGAVFVIKGNRRIKVPVEERPELKLPASFELLQNYPNPFNPSTTIEFALPEQSSVRLAVYNVVGQKVRTLIDKTLPAGSYTIQWDGCDDAGKSVVSGVYVYRLTTDRTELTRKMILVR